LLYISCAGLGIGLGLERADLDLGLGLGRGLITASLDYNTGTDDSGEAGDAGADDSREDGR